jgi:3-isopropylmalate/(R)-2-methylmalate dehydratase small subunit
VAEPFVTLRSPVVVLPASDIDTDQILPARFLTTIQRAGLGARLFHDVRGPGGLAEALEDPRCRAAAILVAGDNFGCGSSREHAPWALFDYGLRVVVSTSFADIFKSNALSNGVLPVEVPRDVHRWLVERPWDELTVDLEREVLTLSDDRQVGFSIEPFARLCLLRGMDPLDFLLAHEPAIASFEERRP